MHGVLSTVDKDRGHMEKIKAYFRCQETAVDFLKQSGFF